MRTLIDVLIGIACFAASYAARLMVEEMRSREPGDLSNGRDDPGYRQGGPDDEE